MLYMGSQTTTKFSQNGNRRKKTQWNTYDIQECMIGGVLNVNVSSTNVWLFPSVPALVREEPFLTFDLWVLHIVQCVFTGTHIRCLLGSIFDIWSRRSMAHSWTQSIGPSNSPTAACISEYHIFIIHFKSYTDILLWPTCGMRSVDSKKKSKYSTVRGIFKATRRILLT